VITAATGRGPAGGAPGTAPPLAPPAAQSFRLKLSENELTKQAGTAWPPAL